MSDPHDWKSWDNYLLIHEKRLGDTSFVREPRLAWRFAHSPDGTVNSIKLEGTVQCHSDVSVTVYKRLYARYSARGVLQVRGAEYSYNAQVTGKFTILRYDNGHQEDPADFHRHEFDLETGEPLPMQHLKRDDMPTLADFLDEVARMVGFNGA